MGDPFRRNPVAGGGGTAAVSSGPSAGGVSFTQARSEISDGMAGRVSLAMLDFIILGMVVFYIWTRNAQGGS